MITSDHPSLRRILVQVARPIIFFFAIALLVAYLDHIDAPLFRMLAVPDLAITVLGAALTILLGFRTTAAYGRWWEARTLWGGLVNNSRTIARQSLSFPNTAPESERFTKKIIYHQMAYIHALRCHLRGQQPWDDISPFLDEHTLATLTKQQNVPAAILNRMGRLTADAANANLISEWRLQRFDESLTELFNLQGGCERIKNTPLPRQYDQFPEMLVKAYCMVLPLVLVDELRMFTPFVSVFVSFAFLVLNRIGKNLEDPFENKVYDTPLTSISRTVEINLRQALGEQDLPAPVVARDGVVW